MIRYNDFFDYVEHPVANRELDAALGWIRASRELIEPDSILAVGPAGLDITFTTALNLMSRWRTQLGQDFYVVHDYSSPMVAEQALWEALTSVDVPPESIGLAPNLCNSRSEYSVRRSVTPRSSSTSNSLTCSLAPSQNHLP